MSQYEYQGPPAPPAPPTPPAKKKHTLRNVILALVALVVIIAAFSSGGGGSDPASQPGPGRDDASSAAPQATTKPKAQPAKKWVRLASVSGSADKTSDTITTTGGKVRISYRFKGSGTIVGAVYLLAEGTDLQTDGGIPEVMVSEPGSDSKVVRKDAGDYFIQVTSTDPYTVTVDEER